MRLGVAPAVVAMSFEDRALLLPRFRGRQAGALISAKARPRVAKRRADGENPRETGGF